MTSHDSHSHSQPIYGLILVGGHSVRMGTNKALLPHPLTSAPLYQHLVRSLSPHCSDSRVFLSLRPDQIESFTSLHASAREADQTLPPIEVVPDSPAYGPDSELATRLAKPGKPPGIGPAAGLLSAHAAHPEARWLITAVDFPLLTSASFGQLLREYKSPASCFRHESDGAPDPFCALWGPDALERLKENVENRGKTGPCKALKDACGLGDGDGEDGLGLGHYIRPEQDEWLLNTNTKEDWERAVGLLKQRGTQDA